MISLVEALNFRCLRYVHQPLDRFHVLVGPNASGKTTFLDVIAFLGRLVSDGLEAAVHERTENYYDLVWGRKGSSFELVVEAKIPDDRRANLPNQLQELIRYEVAIGIDAATSQIAIQSERVTLRPSDDLLPGSLGQRELFPNPPTAPTTILSRRATGARTIVNKGESGNANFNSEVASQSGKGWVSVFRLGPQKSALGNLPDDETKFPAATWLKSLLTDGAQQIVLNSLLMRKPSPPGQSRKFRPDGSNLPWVVEHLRSSNEERFRDWLNHLRMALPDLADVRTIERPEDRHRYLLLRYEGDLEVPSWMASDGTLRLLALTLPAYLDDLHGIFLIEEPENGIHPRAIETMFESLSSVYDAQILMATHSPVILSVASADDVLCFAKNDEGATDIVVGRNHPKLTDWHGQVDLGTLFASGVLS